MHGWTARWGTAGACALAALIAGPTATAAGATGGIAPQVDTAPAPRMSPETSSSRTGGVAPAPAPVKLPSGAPSPSAPQPPASTPSPVPPGAPVNSDVPPRYRALYRQAARSVGLDWRVLAAIGKNESDHGRSNARGVHSGVNFANCCSGPMQICKVRACGYVWQHYGVDGDRNGVRSVYDPDDAVPTAALIVGGLLRLFGPRPALLLAGYNAGPGNVQRYRGVPPFKETQAYVKNGLSYIKRLKP